MADTNPAKKQTPTTPPPPPPGSTEDEDVVQFDLTGDLEDTASPDAPPGLRVNLEEDGEMEELNSMAIDKPVIAEDIAESSMPVSSEPSSYSLAGDDVLDLFETLMQKIEELKANHEESIQNHNDNILREKEAIKKEESEYQQKLTRMLERMDSLKVKLASGPSARLTKK